MKTFMARNAVRNILVPKYSPASNGLAESLVGKFKSAMKRMVLKNPDIMCNLANLLMQYRNTPHSVTGIEPAVRICHHISTPIPEATILFERFCRRKKTPFQERSLVTLEHIDIISHCAKACIACLPHPKLPSEIEEMELISKSYRFPGTIGTIDGTHIPI